jgi:hypothetical protein
MQGIRDLKFNPDENTYEDVAKSYKDEGNFHFKAKKYRLAVANYTEGLRLKVPGFDYLCLKYQSVVLNVW